MNSHQNSGRLCAGDVLAVADAAKIALNESEAERLCAELEGYLALAEPLCPLAGEAPPARRTCALSELREDRVGEPTDPAVLLSQAPSVRDGCVWVPQVMEEA